MLLQTTRTGVYPIRTAKLPSCEFGEEHELFDRVVCSRDDDGRGPIQARKDPHTSPAAQGASSLVARLATRDERIEEPECIGVLDRRVLGTDDAEERSVALTIRRNRGHRFAIGGEERLRGDKPVEARATDGVFGGDAALHANP